MRARRPHPQLMRKLLRGSLMSHTAEHVTPEEFVECFRDNPCKRLIIHNDRDPETVAISSTETSGERDFILEMIFRDRIL